MGPRCDPWPSAVPGGGLAVAQPPQHGAPDWEKKGRLPGTARAGPGGATRPRGGGRGGGIVTVFGAFIDKASASPGPAPPGSTTQDAWLGCSGRRLGSGVAWRGGAARRCTQSGSSVVWCAPHAGGGGAGFVAGHPVAGRCVSPSRCCLVAAPTHHTVMITDGKFTERYHYLIFHTRLW